MRDVWAVSDAYESYVGRWSRRVAIEFLNWLALPPRGRWLDAGCGTGALTARVLSVADPSRVTGVDPSAGFLDAAHHDVRDPRANFIRADARSLPLANDRFDGVVGALMLNFVPEPGAAAAEFARVTVPSGTVAAYVWDYSAGMQLMRFFWDAATDLDPSIAKLDEGRRFPICRPDALRDVFIGAGLRDVSVRAITVPTTFADFDDYWRPFLGGQGPAPGYAMSLSEPSRNELRNLIRSRLPVLADGSIPLTARAWAVRGTA